MANTQQTVGPAGGAPFFIHFYQKFVAQQAKVVPRSVSLNRQHFSLSEASIVVEERHSKNIIHVVVVPPQTPHRFLDQSKSKAQKVKTMRVHTYGAQP